MLRRGHARSTLALGLVLGFVFAGCAYDPLGGMRTRPGPPGTGRIVVGNDAKHTYQLNYLVVGTEQVISLSAVGPTGPGVMDEYWVGVRGVGHAVLQQPAFLEAVGRKDLASKVRSRSAVRISLGVAGLGVFVTGIGALLSGHRARGAWTVGGGLALAGTARFLIPDAVSREEANTEAEGYNARLRRFLALPPDPNDDDDDDTDADATDAPPATKRPQLRLMLGAAAAPAGGTVTLGGAF